MAKTSDQESSEVATAEPVASSLFERVSDYLTSQDWSFTSYPEKDYFAFSLRLKDGSCRVIVDVSETATWSRIMVFVTYPIFVPEGRRVAVAEALNRINFTCALGCMELDFKDGEVRVKTVLEGDWMLGESMIDRVLRRSLDMGEQYFAPLLAIAFGGASPKDVIELASHAGEALQ